MGASISEVGYTSARTRRGTTKPIWACGGTGKKHELISLPPKYDARLKKNRY
jgi:hypothetical protein